MTKRKRTYEEVMSMQERAVSFQENLGHYEAAGRLERLTTSEYAKLRKIEIVLDPVQKRRRSQSKKEKPVDDMPAGPVRIMWGRRIIK